MDEKIDDLTPCESENEPLSHHSDSDSHYTNRLNRWDLDDSMPELAKPSRSQSQRADSDSENLSCDISDKSFATLPKEDCVVDDAELSDREKCYRARVVYSSSDGFDGFSTDA